MIGLALRALGRYVVPMALATVVVLAPIWIIAYRTPWPTHLAAANTVLVRGFILAAVGWMFQLVLVAAAAPLVRSIVDGKPLAQHKAIVAAFENLVRMLVPCLAAIGAIVVGGMALVVPAFVLLVLLSLTGASNVRGMPAPLVDSVAAVRAEWKLVAAIVGAMLAIDIGIAIVGWKFFTVPFAKKLKPPEWATYGNVGRIVAIGLLVVSPIFATLLAAVRVRTHARQARPNARQARQ